MKKTQKAGDEKYTLETTVRTLLGKKLKKLRSEGVLPANIYGPGFKSQTISVIYKDFAAVYKKAQETGVVYLKAGKDEMPVLIKDIHRHPIENLVLHVDFRKIDLSQKIETSVPVKVIGTSDAVTQKGGILLTQSDHLRVEALPTDIPHEIEIDASILKEIGQDVKVADLPKSSFYTIKDEQEKVVLSVTAHKEESLTPETTAEVPEVITAAEDATEGAAEEGSPTAKEQKETPAEESKEK